MALGADTDLCREVDWLGWGVVSSGSQGGVSRRVILYACAFNVDSMGPWMVPHPRWRWPQRAIPSGAEPWCTGPQVKVEQMAWSCG